jgi:hypothetical protein
MPLFIVVEETLRFAEFDSQPAVRPPSRRLELSDLYSKFATSTDSETLIPNRRLDLPTGGWNVASKSLRLFNYF